MKKYRVGVLFGGRSSEHEISLQSAASVIKHLDRDFFEPVPIGINKQGQWFLHDVSNLRFKDSALVLNEEATQLSFSFLNDKIHQLVDVIFPVVHGENCEDGRLQGILDALQIPYIGSGVSGSAMMMDKVLSNYVAMQLGIPVPKWMSFKLSQWDKNPNIILSDISTNLHFPVFVKPVVTGSSIGVSKVKSAEGLIEAIEAAFQFDTHVMVENGIVGREIEIGVLENIDDASKPLVTMPSEIIPTHEFYSYAAKYLDPNGAKIELPAKLPEKVVARMQADAAVLFQAMNGEGLGRVDFMYDEKKDIIYFNEVNSLPGFTSISMYPKMWAHSGVDYKNLLTKLIELAFSRFERSARLTAKYRAQQESIE